MESEENSESISKNKEEENLPIKKTNNQLKESNPLQLEQ